MTIVAKTQDAPTTGLTIHTETFLDVFRDIANENGWCDTAEDVVRRRLGLQFKEYGDEWCCSDHSGHLRFRLTEGQPTDLDAVKVSDLIRQALVDGELGVPDAKRLAGLLPAELAEAAVPKPPTYKVTFTYTRQRPFSRLTSDRENRRTVAEALYSGRDVADVEIQQV